MSKFSHWFAGFKRGDVLSIADLFRLVSKDKNEMDATNTTTERFFKTLSEGKEVAPLSRLKFPSLMTASHVLVQHQRADWQQTVPEIQMFASALIETCRKQGIPMYVHCAFRTKAEQNTLQRQGRSQLQWPNAPHCKGAAVDIVHSKYHWELTQHEWECVGKLGRDLARRMNLNVIWGGDWNDNGLPVLKDSKERFWDPAHWQIASWRNLPTPQPLSEPLRLTPRAILRKY